MTVVKMFQGLTNYFKLPHPNKYLCSTAIIQKKGVLDIIKFDDWLHEQYGQYENKGLSMQDLIRKEYGEEAVHFIKECL